MSHLLVFSTVESRLHADLVIVRLRRAGIPMSSISVAYPQEHRPNSIRCWLSGSALLSLSSGESIAIAGPLSWPLTSVHGTDGLRERVERVGFSHEQAASIEESLLERRIVVAVEARNEPQLKTIHGVFLGVQVEKIDAAGVSYRRSAPISGPRILQSLFPRTVVGIPHVHAA